VKQAEGFMGMFNEGQELMDALQRGRRFTEEILGENERLRLQIVQGESEKMQLETRLRALDTIETQNSLLQEQIGHLQRRFGEVEAENQDFASRYAEISEVNENLANLYVATHRLHSTLDPADVTEIICEIMVELVGAEDFGLLLLDERTNELALARLEGPPNHYPAHILVGEGVIGRAVRDCRPRYVEPANPLEPLAVVPLQIKGHGTGAIVVSKLLHGKMRLSPLGKELLALLAGHAASALTASRLYSSVDRKLRTIEGFMELMKRPQPARSADGRP
jgi:hypothetical protein